MNGRLLAHTEGIGIYWPVITYSSDGWVVLWQDADAYNTSEEVVIHGRMKAMKYSSTGASLWNDPDQTGLMLYDEQIHSLQEDALWIEPDANGGAYCCWINETYFYAQRVTNDGTVAWTTPREISHGGNGWGYSIDASSDGGLLYAWKQHGAQYDIFCNKINAAGNNAWTSPALICRQSAFVTNINLLADEQGGALFLWLDERNSEIAEFFWRSVDATGHPLGSPNGHFVYTPSSVKFDLDISPSMNNGALDGALIKWREEPNGVSIGLAQKLISTEIFVGASFPYSYVSLSRRMFSQSAIALSTDYNGNGICTWRSLTAFRVTGVCGLHSDSAEIVWDDCAVTLSEGFDVQWPRSVVTGNSTIVSIWRDVHNPSGAMFIQSQSLATGAVNFPDALGLDDLYDGECYNQDVLALPNGKSVVAWQDTRSRGMQLYFQILDVTGSTELLRDGIKLVEVANQGYPQLENPILCEDGSGGFFAAFTDNMDGVRVLRATRWNASVEHVGPAEGVIVSDLSSDVESQVPALIVSDDACGAYVAYSSYSDVFILDVYVMRIDENCQPLWKSRCGFRRTIKTMTC
ncbi:MAG: hypothetical protein IPP40_12090 [bacterium]|nr:hypothetical protein [bacterium]